MALFYESSTFHDMRDTFQHPHIGERIALDSYQVGEPPRRDTAKFVLLAKQLGRTDRALWNACIGDMP